MPPFRVLAFYQRRSPAIVRWFETERDGIAHAVVLAEAGYHYLFLHKNGQPSIGCLDLLRCAAERRRTAITRVIG